jgi:hypothetical protein
MRLRVLFLPRGTRERENRVSERNYKNSNQSWAARLPATAPVTPARVNTGPSKRGVEPFAWRFLPANMLSFLALIVHGS